MKEFSSPTNLNSDIGKKIKSFGTFASPTLDPTKSNRKPYSIYLEYGADGYVQKSSTVPMPLKKHIANSFFQNTKQSNPKPAR